ncbi:MAG: TIGR00269 family protein [Candidatus Altiarchaeota archaeon]|nr:TIGR00269 family protein [Candidatus Altiarchaeota archaeon]
MECTRCGRNASIEINYSKDLLCNRCFLELFEKRVRKSIRANRLLNPRDKTAVALSGGKDSAVVLSILKELHKRAPRAGLLAISIDQGVDVCGRTLDASRKICERLGVEHHVFTFREEFGLTLDELVKKTRGIENAAPVCSYCGVLRRRLLNDKARKLGVSKIATGHNLDDEIQTSMMNFIRGELDRMARMGPIVGVVRDAGFIPRIKPLRDSPEDEVLLYARLKGLEFEPSKCPYSQDALRKTIRSAIDLIEEKHPGSKFQMLKSTDRLIPIIRSSMEAGEIRKCSICGEVTSGRLCRVCQIKKELGIY